MTEPAAIPRGAYAPYTQCALQAGSRGQVAYIPKKYAVLHSTVRIKDAAGIWDEWTVTGVYQTMPLIDLDSIRAAEKHFETKLK